ncbi:hypothetical protein F6R98_10295 [Candidatus Methylospira mobilis]|uniref:Uncharacterized protein n=1 Tax=Candidatus Methylospira mobilis TaxID=1808979 RepID=A0A5Q0BL74_9GAMM|nr:hypothetical protein [Candidatus Methylospira mobilis]QFY42954.1 hypothetical protein F6R98_10295 [Candidatus Methylospira mobilis]
MTAHEREPSHENEPWYVAETEPGYITGPGCKLIANFMLYATSESDEQSILNMRRAVACVNACAGLPQDALDGGWTAAGASTYAAKLEKQRDRLLAALKQTQSDIVENDCVMADTAIFIDSVIAEIDRVTL